MKHEDKKTSVLFVCHGNICRSPMAEYIFKDKVHKAGLDGCFDISSAATSTEELGNDIYPPARRVLALHGITGIRHSAHQMSLEEYRHSHVILVMDKWNLRNAVRMTGGDPDGKIRMLLEDEEIEDPWYSGDFEGVYRQIDRGCDGLLEEFGWNRLSGKLK